MTFTAKIEQTFEYKKRMRYLPREDSFAEKECMSLAAERGFVYPSGWIKESGTPPCEHLDVIVMTDRKCELGDELAVRVIGVFVRNDGDHKLVSVPEERSENDLSELPQEETYDLNRLYRPLFTGEGWFGRDRAEQIVSGYFSRRRRKIIVTVQHTESEHHVNGRIGAGYDWELTERGRAQAREIGKRLKCEDCGRGFKMYVSDMKRAVQTAEEINITLNLPLEVRAELREVDAGEGNGQERDWYREHEKKHPDCFAPDFKPFPSAESDRELWERVERFYREIKENDEERILIVSHGTALSFLQAMLMGQSLEGRYNCQFNGLGGSVSRFVIEPNGRVVCSYVNRAMGG